jgi:hypothetical protein
MRFCRTAGVPRTLPESTLAHSYPCRRQRRAPTSWAVRLRGYHLRLEHPIAIKCLKIPGHFTGEAREVFLARFREEGRILVKLADAPGVPQV